jgi:hypothetical protein
MTIAAEIGRGFWWFRINGRGWRCANRKIYAPLILERLGRIRVLRLGRWSIARLKPDDTAGVKVPRGLSFIERGRLL